MAAYVWINGFQGVGKLTAAKHLQALLPGSILLDNHSLIDVVTLPRDHPDYYSERKKARQAAFAKYVYPDDNFTLTKPIIATDCVSACELGASMAAEHKAAATKAGRPFYPVYLHCSSQSEHLSRVNSPERLASHGKLTDVELVRGFLDTLTLFTFSDGLSLDTAGVDASATAEKIHKHLA